MVLELFSVDLLQLLSRRLLLVLEHAVNVLAGRVAPTSRPHDAKRVVDVHVSRNASATFHALKKQETKPDSNYQLPTLPTNTSVWYCSW